MNANPGVYLQNYKYIWEEGAPNIKKIDDKVNVGYTQIFEYDPAGRLKEAKGSYATRSYTYEDGNVYKGNNIIFMSDGATTYQRYYNAQKLMSETSAIGNSTFAYDANGNMISKVKNGNTYGYTYDGENQLISVQKNGQLANAFAYDFAGNRWKKVEKDGTQTLYIGSTYEITQHPPNQAFPNGQTLHTKYIQGPGGKTGFLHLR